MRHLIPALLVVLGLHLSACSMLQVDQKNPVERVDALVHEGHYGKALDLIARLKPTHPDYATLQAKQPAIERAATTYEGRTLRQAQRQAREEHWQEALQTYDQGLERLPKSEPLRQGRERLLQQRADYLAQLDTKLLISEAQRLVHDLPIREEIERVDPKDKKARRAREKTLKHSERTAERLHVCGLQALDIKDSYLAYRCLDLAYRLAPTPEIKDALAQAEKLKSREEGRRRKAQLRKLGRERAERTRVLLQQYQKAFSKGDLLHARDLLNEAIALQPDNPKVKRLAPKLEREIKKQVNNGIEQGRRQYTLGHIQRALDIWTSLQRLDPENKQLNEHIDRAERVLDNLQAIEQRGPSVTVPPP